MELNCEAWLGSHRRSTIFSIAVIQVAFWFCYLIQDASILGYSYLRWDNAEINLPLILETQLQWLNGTLPQLNPYQMMGEPSLASGQAFPFYLPYFLIYLLARVFGFSGLESADFFMFFLVSFHLVLAAGGWSKLFERLGVSPWVAFLGTVGIGSGGFLHVISQVWIWMLPVFTFLPWALLGLVMTAEGQGRERVYGFFGLAFAFLLGCAGTLSQMMLYFGLVMGALCVLYPIIVTKQPKKILVPLFALLGASLMLAPVLLPTLDHLEFSRRSGGLTFGEFIIRGLRKETLIGVLVPLLDRLNGVLGESKTLILYQGAWVFPALVGGARVFSRGWSEQIELRRILVLVPVSALFLVLSMGEHGFLYPLTYGIPVWSSMRWPFKMLILVVPLLGLIATLMLDLYCRNRVKSLRDLSFKNIVQVDPFALKLGVVLTLISLLCSAFYLYRFKLISTFILSSTALVFLNILLLVHFKVRRWIIPLLVVLTSGAVVWTAQLSVLDLPTEKYASVGTKEMKLDSRYRLLPISKDPHRGAGFIPGLQAHGEGHSATMNRYFGVTTGSNTALTPRWYYDVLDTDTLGVLLPDRAKQLFDSPMRRMLNIGYVLVGKKDPHGLTLVRSRSDLFLHQELKSSLVYEFKDKQERAFFVRKNESGRYAETREGRSTVEKADWRPSSVSLDVKALEPTVLALSMLFLHGWSVEVDGKPASLLRVNDALIGVNLAEGSQRVEFRYLEPTLPTAFGIAVMGFVFLILVGVGLARKK